MLISASFDDGGDESGLSQFTAFEWLAGERRQIRIRRLASSSVKRRTAA
jgi:hypothetical protein